MKTYHIILSLLIITLLFFLTAGLGFAQKPGPEDAAAASSLGTVFTYQGHLMDNGHPANGLYDFRFRLYNAASGGSQVGTTVTQSSVSVVGGLFTVSLDFGDVFDGQPRWLEIAVRRAGSGGYTILSPRQALTASPYALYSHKTPWNGLTGVPAGFADNVDNDTTYTAGTGLALSGGAFSIAPTYRLPQGCANGQVAKWNGSAWACGDDNAGGGDFWALTGNSGTNPNTNFLGTTDNQPLEMRVNNQRALRIEPGDGPNIIGGYSGNSVANGVAGAVIGGGGHASGPNRITSGDFSTIGGGFYNTVSANYAAVGGGAYNSGVDIAATVSGGWSNTASGLKATVGGGDNNTASGNEATVGGGRDNIASGVYATVGGGWSNTARGDDATVGGGYRNDAAADFATIAGGGPSDISHPDTTNNRVTDDYGTVGGGGHNLAGNGDNNTTNAQYATVSGGVSNEASAAYSTVGGGLNNTASGSRSTVAGGENNRATGYLATIGGGFGNTAGFRATVGGGDNNQATGSRATIPGGNGNTAAGNYSFAAGRRAKANATGCFVWGDATNADVTCNNTNRTIFRSSGGFYIYTNNGLTSGARLSAGSGSWSNLSDRDAKEHVEPVDPLEVLYKLAQMPVSTWNYKSQDPSIRHIGPMAQDFYAAFGLGEDDKYISSIDAEGVALAAIQGLYRQNQEQARRIAELEAQNAQLQAQLQAIMAQLEALQKQLAGGEK